MLTCPVCRSEIVRRSGRRNMMERLWSLAGRYPYRCHDCQTRFFGIHEPKDGDNKHKDEEPVQGSAQPRHHVEDDD